MPQETKELDETTAQEGQEVASPASSPAIEGAAPGDLTSGTQGGPPPGLGPPAHFDHAQPLESNSFPHQPQTAGAHIPATIPNMQHLLASYGITARYDTVRKKQEILIPGHFGAPDNVATVSMAQITSLANLNRMGTGQIGQFVHAIADQNQFNPVAVWITSKPWDGNDRLQALYDTLVEPKDYPKHLKETLMRRWLVSTVAAALKPSDFRGRGVLTLQGAQSLGKTAWVQALVPDPWLRENVVKLDHHLDAGNKDSLLIAIAHWIVEIGELDSSFKKDIARLKGFLTSDRDKVRRPYAVAESEYPRRTVFCATVNDHNFLVDSTGNSRWWTIPVAKINYNHGIDMQQVFAQATTLYEAGEQWWLTQEEEQLLDEHNKDHRAVSAVRERLLDRLNLADKQVARLPALTASEVLRKTGTPNPTNPQCKECAAVLREVLGEPKRIQGRERWRVPLKDAEPMPVGALLDEDDRF